MTIEKKAYTFREMADAYAVSESTLKKEIREHRLGYVKVGTKVTIPVEEAARWYKSLGSGPTPPAA